MSTGVIHGNHQEDPRLKRLLLPTQPFLELNTAASPMAAQSAQQDLSAEDRIDMDVFNQAIWKSVKGADSQMPAPVHRLGSGRVPEDDDD